MSELKPILFNTQMVRAILDGRKTQTRRAIKPPLLYNDIIYKHENGKFYHSPDNDSFGESEIKPRYKVGDILYVRETWFYESFLEEEETDMSRRYVYRASEPDYPVNVGAGGTGWRPSIHMPKEAARIFLRVTDVRVERLHEMTFDDFCAEGILTEEEQNGDMPIFNLRDRFAAVCNNTIKPADLDRYGWDANPWVWVYEFKRSGLINE